MGFFEERIRPSPGRSARLRDALTVCLLVALAAALLPALDLSWSTLSSGVRGQEDARARVKDVLTRHANEIASWSLLPALGFALALRRGAVDFSVWASAGAGGLAAAGALNAGWPPAGALAAAVAAGAALGACNALLVVFARVPSFAATLVTGAALVWAFSAAFGPGRRSVPLPDNAFEPWRMTKSVAHERAAGADRAAEGAAGTEKLVREEWLPLRVTRMMVVGVLYSVTVLGLLILMANEVGRPDDKTRSRLFAALTASGALAAAGGMCWLLDHPQSAPVPTRVVDDLRIPTAAILAGAAFLGRRRTALIALCLPVAMMLVTAWRQDVWHLPARGYCLQVAVLAGMAVVMHLAFAHAASGHARPRWLASAAATVTVAGLFVLAASVYAHAAQQHRFCQRAGLGIWLAGAVMLLVSRTLSLRTKHPRAAEVVEPATPTKDADPHT